MRSLILIIFTSVCMLYAQDTVRFECSNGKKYKFNGMHCCTENAPGYTVNSYYKIGQDQTITLYTAIFIDGKVNELMGYVFSPKMTNQYMDFEVNSMFEDGKTVYKLMIYENPDGENHHTISEQAVTLCINNFAISENQIKSVNFCFDTRKQLDDFIATFKSMQ